MVTFRNASAETLVFRDDAPGKHIIPPGETFDVVGDQHVPYVSSMPGVESATAQDVPRGNDDKPMTVAELRAGLAELGVEAPGKAPRAVLEGLYVEAIATATAPTPDADTAPAEAVEA